MKITKEHAAAAFTALAAICAAPAFGLYEHHAGKLRRATAKVIEYSHQLDICDRTQVCRHASKKVAWWTAQLAQRDFHYTVAVAVAVIVGVAVVGGAACWYSMRRERVKEMSLSLPS